MRLAWSLFVLGLVAVLPAPAAAADQLLLTRDGLPRASIVIADEPVDLLYSCNLDHLIKERRTQRHAAEELQRYLKRASGALLPIVSASQAPSEGTLVLVGRSALSERFGIDVPTASEGLVIRSFPRGLAIVGEVAPVGTNNWDREVDRGTSNAIYVFLEKHVGYRFLLGRHRERQGGSGLGIRAPDSPTITIETPVEFRDAPAFPHRILWSRWTRDGESRPAFRSGNANRFWANHTQHNWQRHFRETHPEYFLLNEDGTRDFRYLCHSEPGVLQQYLEFWEQYIETGEWLGDWVPPQQHYIFLEPMDNSPACFCPGCQAKMRTGSYFQRHVDLWWGFVRQAALEVEKRWPKRRLATCAYQHHLHPPEFDLPANVDVMICTAWPKQLAGKQPGGYEKNLDLVKTWSAKMGGDRSRLYIFDYYDTPGVGTGVPVLFPHLKQRWLREVRDLVSGEFVDSGGSVEPQGYFMARLWARLLWDPDLDVDAYVTDFCGDFFGPAGEPMAAFYKLMIDRYENVVWPDHKPPLHQFRPLEIFGQTYPPRILDRLESYLARAKGAVGQPAVRSCDVLPDAAVLLRNENGRSRAYQVAMAPHSGVWTNPRLVWNGRKLVYRGKLPAGQKLVIEEGPVAMLYRVASSATGHELPEAGLDVTGQIEGELPRLDDNSSTVLHFHCDVAPEGETMHLELGEPDSCEGPAGDTIYRRRLMWLADEFEIAPPARARYEVHGFMALARIVQKWLDYHPTYEVAAAAGAPPPSFAAGPWQQASEARLVRGTLTGGRPLDNFGFPADVATRVRMLHDQRNLYVAFHCAQPERPSEADSVAVLVYDGHGEPSFSFTCPADGSLETKTDGFEAHTISGDGWWSAFLTIPKVAIQPDGKPQACRAELLRTRGDKGYIWVPRVGSPWYDFHRQDLKQFLQRRGQIRFAGS